jgi:hypothetical protein
MLLSSGRKPDYISCWRRVILNLLHEQYGLLQQVRLPELWSWILWPQPRQISPHSILYYWQITLLLFKIWENNSVKYKCIIGPRIPAFSQIWRGVEFCIFLLDYLYKTTHQLLRSKHMQLMGPVGCFLVHHSAEPYQLLYELF